MIPRLDPPLRRRTTETVGALRNLLALSAGWRPRSRSRFRGGQALPAAELLRIYRRAERRFRVDWEVLAAVNLVETQFNKLRNNSVAGAQGPMQFIPATWREYGRGGNIRDPRDAIPGAANLLRANGAPRDYRRALYRYNPSPRYVRAVLPTPARWPATSGASTPSTRGRCSCAPARASGASPAPGSDRAQRDVASGANLPVRLFVLRQPRPLGRELRAEHQHHRHPVDEQQQRH